MVMNNIILLSVLVLSAIGIVAALLLYFVSQKFKVYEDPMIGNVADLLPGANCGGCGFAGCRNFAEAIVKAGGLNGKMCPAGGASVNEAISKLFGTETEQTIKKMLVLRCNGSCENAQVQAHYDSIKSCAFANTISAGENKCVYGCLGCGDCVAVCKFGALSIDKITGLPTVDYNKCVLCEACVKTCPRRLLVSIEQKENGVVWVACANKEKGAEARKNCTAACIACTKCTKVCEYDAIAVKDNLAIIDENKCIACGKCVENCAFKVIHNM